MSAPVVPSVRPLREDVAAEIRSLMAYYNISRKSIGTALGVSHTTVWRRLNGSYPFDLDELEAVATVIGVPVSRLFPQETSSDRSNTITARYDKLTESMRIPAQPQHPHLSGGAAAPSIGGSTRTRPLVDLDRLTEPNRVASIASPDHLIHFDPAPPNV